MTITIEAVSENGLRKSDCNCYRACLVQQDYEDFAELTKNPHESEMDVKRTV